MHTSERITQADFVYRRRQDTKAEVLSFTEAYPDYHPQDRVGLVSPRLEDGVFGLAGAVLGLATGFYDCLRSQGGEFFNYPQHHVFIGGREGRVHTRNGDRDLSIPELGSAWGWLDVWPETNWHICPATPAGMIEAAFRLQVNRLFWPVSFMPGTVDEPLSHYAYRLLRGRLKSVWYYNCEDGNLEVRASGSAADVIRESLERLPGGCAESNNEMDKASRPWTVNRFRSVEPEAFLEDMSVCFTDG
ncbi:MAG: hypothetical protein F4207_05460 [Gemmatimonadetes bacterium]|nr:hypothetical protein [Gemmatimonadota bacterium]MYG15862.1 hypothetical protein [Gemmatimonadota bacterium]